MFTLVERNGKYFWDRVEPKTESKEKKFQITLTGEEAVAVVKWLIQRREEIEIEIALQKARIEVQKQMMEARRAYVESQSTKHD